jgi:hypothetical protein
VARPAFAEWNHQKLRYLRYFELSTDLFLDLDSIERTESVLNGHGRRAAPNRSIRCFGLAMDLNRNQFFFIGLMVLLIGLQVRYVSAYVLNPETTKFLADRTGQSSTTTSMLTMFGTATGARKVVQPPEWLSWCMLSIGAVLCLHSLAMPKPG